MFFAFAGSCSPAQAEAISQLHPESSLGCHLSFTSDAIDFSANDVFRTHTGFDTSVGEERFVSKSVSVHRGTGSICVFLFK